MSLLNGKKQASVAISVYWYYQNIRVNGNQVGLLTEFVKQQGKPIRLKVYSNFGDAGQKNQVKSLEKYDWECVHVPSDLKNSVDNHKKMKYHGGINA